MTLRDYKYMRYQTPGNVEFQLKNKKLPLIANLKETRCTTVFVDDKFKLIEESENSILKEVEEGRKIAMKEKNVAKV